MKNLRRLRQALFTGALSAALAFGAITVASTPTEAMGPVTILCGPSFQWS